MCEMCEMTRHLVAQTTEVATKVPEEQKTKTGQRQAMPTPDVRMHTVYMRALSPSFLRLPHPEPYGNKSSKATGAAVQL